MEIVERVAIVETRATAAHARLDKVISDSEHHEDRDDDRFDKLNGKIDRLMWVIVGACVSLLVNAAVIYTKIGGPHT